MTWVKTPSHYLNLDSISMIDVDLVGMSIEIHGHGPAYPRILEDEDAIALIQAIERCDFVDESNPFKPFIDLDGKTQEDRHDVKNPVTNSGIPL